MTLAPHYALYGGKPPAGPRVRDIVPNHGPEAGGTRVELRGSGLEVTARVFFDGGEATDLDVSPNVVRCTSPPGVATVPVYIFAPAAIGVGSFHYDADEPEPPGEFDALSLPWSVAWWTGGPVAQGVRPPDGTAFNRWPNEVAGAPDGYFPADMPTYRAAEGPDGSCWMATNNSVLTQENPLEGVRSIPFTASLILRLTNEQATPTFFLARHAGGALTFFRFSWWGGAPGVGEIEAFVPGMTFTPQVGMNLAAQPWFITTLRVTATGATIWVNERAAAHNDGEPADALIDGVFGGGGPGPYGMTGALAFFGVAAAAFTDAQIQELHSWARARWAMPAFEAPDVERPDEPAGADTPPAPARDQ